ncbi:tubulin binding cofactor C-domain-containing protein [Scenedesmus sp. NREL 46B-D3]|nr:tubulin binding cofactor C-domain-containing protein [Scenedesmus sp. NREL 46B-D3]
MAASVIQKLAARQATAAAERERQQQQHLRESDPRENLNQFVSDFLSSYSQLQEQSKGLQEQAALAGGDETAKQALLQRVEELSSGVAKLEKDIAGAAYFLPPYDLRSCTAQLQELRHQAAATKQQLQPKRKFAFSSKNVTRKAPVHTTTAAAGSAARAVQQQLQDVQLADQAAATAGAVASEPHNTRTADANPAASPPPTDHDLALITSGQGALGLRGALLVYGPGQQQQLQPGQAFVLHDLQDCTVFLVGALSALRLQQLRRCRVYAGPVAGATFVSGISDCTLMVASHQVRIHDACSSDLYLRTRSHPIIEHSSGLRFAPAPFEQLGGQLQPPSDRQYSNLQAHDYEQQQQQAVQDFGWVKASQSPNWALLPEQQRQSPQPLPRQ